MNYQILACSRQKQQPAHLPVDVDAARLFGYYWIQVKQDGPWIAAFWYEAADQRPGFFDCTNTPGLRYVFQAFAVGDAVRLPDQTATLPEVQPEGYHWVQSEPFGDWVVALWRNAPFDHRGKKGHGYFDGSNWWNSNYHVIPAPYAYGGKVNPTA